MMMSLNAFFYMASTTPLGESTVSSETALFVPQWVGVDNAPNDVVCMVGSSFSMEPDLVSINGGGGSDCTAGNGCGVHIHSGMGCEDKAAQGGHWYNSEVLEADPWATVGYLSTNTEGYAQFATCVSTGFDLASDPDQLIGHAFIVHANDGSRASCGVITEAPTDYIQPDGMKAEMTPIPGVEDTNSTMAGEVTIMMGFQGISDATCYMGYAMGLEPSVESFMMGTGSDECDVPNGCGAHIHSGTGCEDKDAQGGHYFDKDTIGEDPWKVESYYETDSVGETALFGCAITGQGAKEYESKPFIVHNTLGGRVLCGMIETPATEVYEPPSGSATKSVVAAFTSMLLVLALF